jgi:hypothetical protein
LTAWTFLVGLVVLVGSAEPRRLLVVDFEGGPKARELQDQVVRWLPKDRFTVVETRAYEFNNALMTGRDGVRLGGELTGAF